MAITIQEIKGKKALKRFAEYPYQLYKDHPYHIPQLLFDEIGTLSSQINPAFEFCESIYYMAYEGERPVGRIAGIINHKVNEKLGQRHARFGFVDFEDDPEVSRALFGAVEAWARSKGMTQVEGPLGFTDFDQEGMLVEGFDQLGTMATIYNYPYYPEHVTSMGYEKAVDWIEFKIYIPESIPVKHQRITDIVRAKYNLRILKFSSTKQLIKEWGVKMFQLINESYDVLYGYSPLSEKQIHYYIKMYISMVRLDNVTLIINENEELVGVGIAVPSMAKAMQRAKGHLFPFGFIHLLKALKGRNDVVDLLLVAVRPDYQNKGVNALLFSDLIPVFIKNGYRYAESNPELEVNEKVQSQWQYFDYEQHKRRRAFIKNLGE